MVKYAFLIITTVVATLLLACGGNDSDGGSSGSGGVTSPTVARPTASGPNAVVIPRNGPPGTEITVQGSGFPANATVEVLASNAPTVPYSTVTTGADGSFSTIFRIEKQPNGQDLQVGRFDLIARSGATEAGFAFQVETRRPLTGGGGTGPG
jgi:hypothetical protein